VSVMGFEVEFTEKGTSRSCLLTVLIPVAERSAADRLLGLRVRIPPGGVDVCIL
jgi:hypothetical protein